MAHITITSEMLTSNYNNDICAWALWAALCDKDSNGDFDEMLKKMGVEQKLPLDFPDVKLVVNGVEVDLGKTLTRYSDNIDRHVEEQAIKLIKDKCDTIFAKIEDIERKCIDAIS